MAPENVFEAHVDTVDAEFDLEAVIARFAGDDSSVSHALPASLSPEQRQLAKKLVGCHPHLECESYGFGPERQLHLFRKRSKGVRMRVKNTFIDAWQAWDSFMERDGGDAKLGIVAPVSRSLPSDWRSMVVAALATPVVDEGIGDLAQQLCSTPSPCSSPTGLHSKNAPSLLMEVPCETVEDFAQLCSTPSPCNSPTLLHFPNMLTPAKVHDPSGTELMTSPRCAPLAEQQCGTPQSANCVGVRSMLLPPPPASPVNVVMLHKGTEVEIDGLIARPDFNGLAGIVQSWDPMMRRYDVLLDPVGGGGPRHVKIKRENLILRLSLPPPPESAAILSTTLDLSSCLSPCHGAKEGFQHGSGGEMAVNTMEASSPTSETPEWYSWQYCDPNMSPHSDPNMSPMSHQECDEFGGTGAGWDYSSSGMSFNNAAADSEDCWLQQSFCETSFSTEWAAVGLIES